MGNGQVVWSIVTRIRVAVCYDMYNTAGCIVVVVYHLKRAPRFPSHASRDLSHRSSLYHYAPLSSISYTCRLQ